MHILFHRLSYLVRARHRKGHGIHSPFVFDFVSSVLCGKDRYDYSAIKARRKDLLKDRSRIKVEDRGEGSKKRSGEVREVRHIAKTTPVKPKYGRFLTRMAGWYKPDYIVELGTGMGLSSAYLAGGCPDCILYTIEGSKSIHEMARQTMGAVRLDNAVLIHGLFADKLSSVMTEIEGCNSLLVFIDGDHCGERVLGYVETLLSGSFENLVIILDDIYWSASMTSAWKAFIHRPEIAVSIDLFQFGILFIKKGISKKHYKIRF